MEQAKPKDLTSQELDELAINTIRTLSIDAVQQAKDLWMTTIRGDAVAAGPSDLESPPSANQSNNTVGRASR